MAARTGGRSGLVAALASPLDRVPGVTEVAEQVFDLPVRLGSPTGAEGFAEPDTAPQFATAIGLAMYGARHRPPRQRMSLSVPVGGLSRMGDRVKAWFSEIF